jgi:hypothetical protein
MATQSNTAGQSGNVKSSSLTRRAPGPRTRQGKERSKHNAQKHRIFSEVVVLEDERDEFESLLNGLWNDLQPVDTLEITAVDKLATLLWRQRRVLTAEAAEIQKGRDFVEWDEEREQEERAAEILRSSTNCGGGLITTIANPKLLERCLELLAQLKSAVKRDGLNPECDKGILTKLYGEYRQEDCRHSLFNGYLIWLAYAFCPDEKRQDAGIAYQEEAKQNFLHELELEEKRLLRFKKDRTAKESARLRLISLSRSIPTSAVMDRLLRYETKFDHEIDRLLKQLERLQRRRLGQPLPPSIDVNVSSEE